MITQNPIIETAQDNKRKYIHNPTTNVNTCRRDNRGKSRQVTDNMSNIIIVRISTRVGTLIVATIYLQLIQNRYMFRSFTVLHYSHQHCVQPVASDVEVVGYL